MSPLPTVSQRIKSFNDSLLPLMVRRKYQLLASNPFRFYRGTNHLFYEDLSMASALPPSPSVWLCGDLHLENYGSYKGDNRLVYFDLSDFDEGILGPALWEVTRMVTSIFTGFAALHIDADETEKCAAIFLKKYADVLASGKARHIELATSTGIVKRLLEKVNDRDIEKWLKKRIEENDKGHLKFKEIEGKQLKLEDMQLKEELVEHISRMQLYDEESLNDFTVQDVCFRIAGTGSLGVKRYLFLLHTRHKENSYWLLDMKEAKPSALLPYVKVQQPAWASEGARVISVEYRMQDVPEALLTTTEFRGTTYRVQEMQPTEDKIEFHQVKDDLENIYEVIEHMALLTASAQLRSSGRQGSAIADDLIEFGREISWREAVLAYSRTYAKQVKHDYEQYLEDFNDGFFEV